MPLQRLKPSLLRKVYHMNDPLHRTVPKIPAWVVEDHIEHPDLDQDLHLRAVRHFATTSTHTEMKDEVTEPQAHAITVSDPFLLVQGVEAQLVTFHLYMVVVVMLHVSVRQCEAEMTLNPFPSSQTLLA
jgi:ABC-type sulfate transport system substrate-binding protein